MGPERNLLQGLIHAAVALHHFETGNLGGARKMHVSTLKYIEPFGEAYHGINLAAFRAAFNAAFAELSGPHIEYPSGIELRREMIPKLGPL